MREAGSREQRRGWDGLPQEVALSDLSDARVSKEETLTRGTRIPADWIIRYPYRGRVGGDRFSLGKRRIEKHGS
jgi:hypothetical protein